VQVDDRFLQGDPAQVEAIAQHHHGEGDGHHAQGGPGDEAPAPLAEAVDGGEDDVHADSGIGGERAGKGA